MMKRSTGFGDVVIESYGIFVREICTILYRCGTDEVINDSMGK